MSKLIKRLIILIWVGFLGGTLSFTTLIYMVKYDFNDYFGGMPPIEFIENPTNDESSELYAADSVLLGKYFRENRTEVDYTEISSNVFDALIATEDERYYEHSGVDLRALARMVFGIATFNRKGGGSTISQQLAKNIFDMRDSKEYRGPAYESKWEEPTIKIKEWIIATRLERAYTKKEIMAMYLNTVSFGHNTFGIKSAAKTYFGVHPFQLKKEEAAVLVGILKANTFYNPKLNPKNSKRRRNIVLGQMGKYDFITEQEKDSLQELPLTLNFGVENHINGLAPYFRAQIRKELMRWCKRNGYDLYGDGLKVYTTINTNMQQKAEVAVHKHMSILQKQFFKHWKGKNPWRTEGGKEDKSFFQRRLKNTYAYRSLKKKYGSKSDSLNYYLNVKRPMIVLDWDGPRDTVFSTIDSVGHYLKFLHTGMASIDPNTGHIKAWVGGINFKFFQRDHVNGSMNQPGSTFKPFLYLAALDWANLSPCDSIRDEKVLIPTGDGKYWSPPNYSNTFSNKNYALRRGLAESKNSIAGKLMEKIGARKLIEYAKYCGIKSKLEANPALCLGTSDVNVLEMVGAYSTFVNEGYQIQPILITRIEDKDGNVVARFKSKKKQVISKSSANKMAYMLQGATSPIYKNSKGWPSGTAMRLRGSNAKELGGEKWEFTNQIGGKTGTTNNASDGWFMGVTPELVTGIWVGADYDRVHFRGGSMAQGSRLALPIFGHYLKSLYDDPESGISTDPFRPEVDEVGARYCQLGDSTVVDSLMNNAILMMEENEELEDVD